MQDIQAEKTQSIKMPRGAWGTMLLLFAAPLAALLLFEGFARGGLGTFPWIGERFPMFLLNYGLLASVFWLFTLFRSGRVRATVSIVFTFLLSMVGMASYYKIAYRFEPVLLTDIFQLGDMKSVLTHLNIDINWTPVIILALCTAGVLYLCLRRIRCVRARHNFIWPVLGVLLFMALLPACTFQNPYVGSRTDMVGYARGGGSLYAVIAAEKKRQEIYAIEYTDEEVEAAYSKASALTAPDASDSPNIIFVLWESFTDEAHLSQYLDLTDTLMPFYQQLTATCRTGEIYVPKMGGGTSETEFEVLTAMKSDYTQCPYSMGIPKLNSVASILRQRGYAATAIHWYDGVFYNRFQNHRQLGFDQLYTKDTTSRELETLGMFVSDQEHFRSVLSKMRSTNERDFIFCITMQNHGVYSEYDLSQTYDVDTPFANFLSEEAMLTLRNYCYLLRQSDKALESFIGELSALSEPTVVLFFGDHIPPFGREVYQELGVSLNTDQAHMAPYFIWSNVPDMNVAERADMEAWELAPYTLAAAGIHSDPFFSCVDALRQRVPGPEAAQDETFRILSRDALVGAQVCYQKAGFTIESPNYQIGGPMELMEFETQLVDGAVFVLPVLKDANQSFRLAVNGQRLDDWKVLETDKPFTLQCVMENYSRNRFNQTQTYTFQSTDDLLAHSRRPQTEIIDLSKESFTIEKEGGGFLVVVTQGQYKAQVSSLTLDGTRLSWQQKYGFRKAGEYYLCASKAAPVAITLSERDFEGYPHTSEGIAAYFKDHNATLTCYRPQGTALEGAAAPDEAAPERASSAEGATP